jgi:tRNA-guanine family transglycosylase
MLGAELNTLHNLHYYQRLMAAIRSGIRAGTLDRLVVPDEGGDRGSMLESGA